MIFHRQLLRDSLRNGTIVRSTMISDTAMSQSYQTFIPDEYFHDSDEIEQKRIVSEAYEMIEGKLRDMANAG